MSSPLSVPGVVPASRLERPVAPLVSCGIAQVDALTGGLPRGALTEVCGPTSSGRTSILLAALAEATERQEICALVDTGDSFDPRSAAVAGIDLDRLLWVRCSEETRKSGRKLERGSDASVFTGNSSDHRMFRSPGIEAPGDAPPFGRNRGRDPWFARIEQALKATDLLLQSGGFGVVTVDLAEVPPECARRIPLSSWFRFRRAVEHTPTVLLVLEQEPYAKTCASLVLRTTVGEPQSAIRQTARVMEGRVENGRVTAPTHAQLFNGISVTVEMVRERDRKKPSQSVGAQFDSRTEWAV